MSAKQRREARKGRNLKAYPPNEVIFRDYIERRAPKSLNPQWVFWMLAMLYEANQHKQAITDVFLKAHSLAKQEPPIELDLGSVGGG